jgi:hypothetical protein
MRTRFEQDTPPAAKPIVRAALIAFVAVASMVGCSARGDDAAAGSDDLSASALKGLCGGFAKARCSEFIKYLPEGFAANYKSVDDCATQRTASCVAKYSSRSVSATASDVKACFDAYGTLSPEDFVKFNDEGNPAMPPACAPLLKGKLADGQPCAFDSECTGGECVKKDSCGTCATRHAAGEACKADNDCTPGLSCHSDGKCAAPSPVGAACGASSDCEPGKWCNSNACAAPLPDGAACKMTGWIDCDWTNARTCDSASHTCQVEAIHVLGESCGWENAAGGELHFRGRCGPGLRCAQNSVRAFCLPVVKAGQGCFFSSGPDDAQCDPLSDCVDGTCVERKASACTSWKAPAAVTGPNPGNLPIATDFGGPTLHHVELITVTLPGYALRDHVRALDDHIANSDYVAAAAGEYGIKSAHHLASVELDEGLPATVTNEDIQDFLEKKIAAGLLPKPPAFSAESAYYYMFYLPPNVVMNGPPYGITCKTIGAYHDVASYPYQFAYGVIPNCTLPAGYPYTDTQYLETSAYHELIEGMTDPDLNMSTAYFAPPSSLWGYEGGELTDFCDGNYYIDDAGFLAARSWSNKNAAAGVDPCLPLEAGNPPYFNVKSDTTTTAAAGTTAKVTLTGWTSGARADWRIRTSTLNDDMSLPDGAISLDKATIGTGGTATLSVAIPATAKSGQSTVIEIKSDDPSMTGFRKHVWILQVTAK